MMHALLSDLRAIIFDMDGVLFLSGDCHAQAFAEVLQGFGIKRFSYPSIAGMRTDEAFRQVLQEQGCVATDESVHLLTKKKRQRALELLEAQGEVAPGARELLCVLRQKGYKLALASSASSQTVEMFLKKLGQRDAFDVVLNGSEVERAKPAPDIYQLAVERLGLVSRQCVVIEDAVSGAQAAHRAGISLIVVTTQSSRVQFASFVPVAHIERVAELGALV